MRIFDENELYDLISAEHSAQSFEEETGCGASLFEYADEDEYNDKLAQIDEDEFFDQVRQWALAVKADFNELEELNEDDFDTDDDFWERRREIQGNIIAYIEENCGDYLE